MEVRVTEIRSLGTLIHGDFLIMYLIFKKIILFYKEGKRE